MKRRWEWAAIFVVLVAFGWFTAAWVRCEAYCYERCRFANHTLDGCVCLPPYPGQGARCGE